MREPTVDAKTVNGEFSYKGVDPVLEIESDGGILCVYVREWSGGIA